MKKGMISSAALFAVTFLVTLLLNLYFTQDSTRASSSEVVKGVPWVDPKHPCGPTCIAIVGRLNNRPIRLDEAVGATQPDSLGRTSMAELMTACERFGLHAAGVEIDGRQMGRLRIPAIAHTNNQHFMVLVPNQSGELMALDPPREPSRPDPASLRKLCTGKLILVGRSADELDSALVALGLPRRSKG